MDFVINITWYQLETSFWLVKVVLEKYLRDVTNVKCSFALTFITCYLTHTCQNYVMQYSLYVLVLNYLRV